MTPRQMRERAVLCLRRAEAAANPEIAADLKQTAEQLLLSADEIEEQQKSPAHHPPYPH